MSTDDIMIGLVALVLIVFSLVVALVIPRRDTGFPGRNLRLFALVAVVLVAGMLSAVEVLGETHHFGGEGHEAETGAAAETAATTGTGGAETGAAETGATQPAGDPQAGEQIFASQGCGSCHTLEAAGTTGTVGPNLDELKPSFEAAVTQVTNGGGGMPAFGGRLSEKEIEDVAAYVVESTKG